MSYDYTNDERYKGLLAHLSAAGFRGHPRFFELLAQAACTHSDKNADYTGGKEPLANLKRCENIGIPASTGVVVRLTDKDSRFEGWFEKYKAGVDAQMAVKDETPIDTLVDRAVYTLLLVIILEEEIANRQASSAQKGLETGANAA